MTTLTKGEIRWILNFVTNEREDSKYLKDLPNQQFAQLHKLNYENMASLAEKLEIILKSGTKRIAVK